ncbi:MAG: winged helix-turn-helix domain-containing protein [Gammaproteobacteria bacterium]|nr:winged helix-turn-helix domain-containing protein [Gammaproteobacteria bacterium]
MIELTTRQLRQIVLDSHGLTGSKPFGSGVSAVRRAITQLHYVQIDTISVVDRAHHHVLKTRIPDYTPAMLHQLQFVEKSIFEYWSHAAAYMDMRDYRFYLPIKNGYRHKRILEIQGYKDILSRIKSEGPLQSKDFEPAQGQSRNGWWDWKPAKIALEQLFLAGDLMISERKGFQKVYDLAERVLPAGIDTRLPTEAERGQFYIRGMLANLGVAKLADIAYSRAAVKRLSGFNIQSCIAQSLNEMVETGEVAVVHYQQQSYYCLSRALRQPGKSGRKRVIILSPFDNLVINRRRLRELFDFNYLLECYLPSAKRQFGYFTLPMLFGDTFIGRLDAKADRKSSNLCIHNIWLEAATVVSDRLVKQLALSLRRFQTELGCNSLTLKHVKDIQVKRSLKQILGNT